MPAVRRKGSEVAGIPIPTGGIRPDDSGPDEQLARAERSRVLVEQPVPRDRPSSRWSSASSEPPMESRRGFRR